MREPPASAGPQQQEEVWPHSDKKRYTACLSIGGRLSQADDASHAVRKAAGAKLGQGHEQHSVEVAGQQVLLDALTYSMMTWSGAGSNQGSAVLTAGEFVW